MIKIIEFKETIADSSLIEDIYKKIYKQHLAGK